MLSIQIFAQYTTPNTGVNWNLDDLVTNSGGIVIGAFPNYSINNNIIVSANDRVFILPGSNVMLSGSTTGFEVYGKFVAVGTYDDSITFSSSTQDSTGLAYSGIYFLDSSIDTACVIGYLRIEYAYYGIRCLGASPIIASNHFWKCRRGIQLSSSNATIRDNIIERSYEYGITMTLGSSPLIEDNTLANNNTQGTSAKNQISIGLQGDNSPIIRNNIIYGGTSIPTGGISLWVSGASAFSNAVIEGNEIFNNAFGITLLSSSNGIIDAIVKNNKIYNNNINPNALVSGSGINVNGSPTNQPIITGNEIFGNWWGITIQNGTTVQAGPNPNIGNVENADTTDDGMNIFYNNVQGIDTFDVYNNCTNDVFAQNNDWRVYDSTSIEQHVFHKVDNAAHGLIKFVPFSSQIPVELTSFSANVVDGNISLNWITATELNNLGFEIQKSPSLTPSLKEGALEQFNWQPIGFVIGNGTSTDIKNYTFTDLKPLEGKNYYRLKQLDFDGSFEYSKIIEVDFNLPIKFSLEQNYPNPFNPITTIKYSIPAMISNGEGNLNVTLKVYDVLGNEIATLVNEVKPSGSYEVSFDASQISSGVYYYRINTGNIIETKKMVLLK
jgi:parallel beta-helix repeat protein